MGKFGKGKNGYYAARVYFREERRERIERLFGINTQDDKQIIEFILKCIDLVLDKKEKQSSPAEV